MERAASLGHSITEREREWAPERERECSCSNTTFCFHLWASSYTMCEIFKMRCVLSWEDEALCVCIHANAGECECFHVWRPRQTHTQRWERRRPTFQTRLGLWLPSGLPDDTLHTLEDIFINSATGPTHSQKGVWLTGNMVLKGIGKILNWHFYWGYLKAPF